ncbi:MULTISPECIES: TetR/AcrR family transcriptional regulator [unclassified Pseudonocardia]|uniref:TetR/AcrR family transcriptional regulator n=1 Tax=unclassified Pseudonocardia TaxID=2619320 RepID=UPI0007610DD6|nr:MULTISPECIES: TetR/AcrR family transcriptional regulator [unclassified Pseudonocardia]
MPRPARFDQDTILDAALRVIAAHGPAGMTVEAVAGEMGGHVGSIYYRFPTKDHLLARLWIRCARTGQAGMIAALSVEDVETALRTAVLHYPRWAREDRPAAQVLAAYGREQLSPHWPDDLAAELATVNDDLAAAVSRFTGSWYGEVTPARRRAATLALLDLPGAAIRRYLLAGRPPPSGLDAVILAASRAALDAA